MTALVSSYLATQGHVGGRVGSHRVGAAAAGGDMTLPVSVPLGPCGLIQLAERCVHTRYAACACAGINRSASPA
jgi:hypothetical protein